MRRSLVVLALGMLLALSGQVKAGLILHLDQTQYSTASGGTVVVQAYLTETGTGSLLALEGLINGGLRLRLDPASTAVVTLSGVNAVQPNPGFDDLLGPKIFGPDFGGAAFPVSAADNLAGLSATVDLLSPAVGEGLTSICLGSFSLVVTGLPGASAELTPDVLGGTFVGNIGGLGTELDALIGEFRGATIRITGDPVAVPEPASALLLLGLLGLAWPLRRRRQGA